MGCQTSSQACGGQGMGRRVSTFSQGQVSRVLGGGLTEGSAGWATQPLSNQRSKRPRLELASGSGRGADRTRTHAREHTQASQRMACGTPAHTTGFCHALSNERVTASVRAGLGMPPEGTPVILVQNEGCGAGNSGDPVLEGGTLCPGPARQGRWALVTSAHRARLRAMRQTQSGNLFSQRDLTFPMAVRNENDCSKNS